MLLLLDDDDAVVVGRPSTSTSEEADIWLINFVWDANRNDLLLSDDGVRRLKVFDDVVAEIVVSEFAPPPPRCCWNTTNEEDDGDVVNGRRIDE